MKLHANDILFEDQHLLVAVKPAGVLSQGDEGMEGRVRAYLQEKTGRRPFLHAVHRLDRQVKGLLLFARRTKSLTRLNEALREGKMEKTYHAIVKKRPPHDEGVLEHNLMHGDHRAFVDPSGKHARLSYRLLHKVENGWLLEVKPETGRYHQIRVQFAEIGCPIVGDVKYGGIPLPDQEILLTHVALSFPHPMSGETVSLQFAAR